jgi:hypothetical protein
MFTYEDGRMSALHERFRELREMVDTSIDPVRRFQSNHRSELYKAILKSFSIEDADIVEMTLRLAQDRYPAADVQVYPMLHLAGDTSERGTWHRDGAEKNRRVFWIPMTPYEYQGLSVIDWSSGILSKFMAFLGSRLVSLDLLATRLKIGKSSYYAWSPRMIHRGNFNTSENLSSAMVIFLDQTAKPPIRNLRRLEPYTVRERLDVIKEAIGLDADGNVVNVDPQRLKSLPEPFLSNFLFYFSLRTKINLNKCGAAAS